MVPDYIKEKILENSTRLDRYGMRDLVWNKENAEKVICSIMPDDIGILGGDVYIIENDRLRPLYDNWYCEPNEGEAKKDFFLRTKQKSLSYIMNYPVKTGENILFSLVFTEILD